MLRRAAALSSLPFLLLLLLVAPIAAAEADSDLARSAPHRRPKPAALAETARWLMHESTWGTLSTISSQPEIMGAPFGNPQSLVDGPYRDRLFGDNSTGIPFFFVSDLDVSQQDALENPLVSLTLSEAALKNGCAMTDPESPLCVRLTVTGDLVEVVDEDEKAFAMRALFQRHPRMQGWPTDHNWKVKKIVPAYLFVLDMFGGAKPLSVEEYLGVEL